MLQIQKVMKLLAAPRPDAGPAKLSKSLLGRRLCNDAFSRLLAIGSGRMRKLVSAAVKGEEPPLDRRCYSQRRLFRRTKRLTAKREVVVEFLEELYQTVAESMAEVKLQEPVPQNKALAFRRSRGRKPRLAAQQRRMKDEDKSEMRMLPPGSFSEYLALLNLRLDAAEKITLKLFSLVWSESFGARLAIREKTQHAQCAQCVKHKHILRHLRGDLKARRGQQKLYAEHLERQYRDRVVYWRARSCSRLKTPLPSNHVVVAMILDAIDHSKFKYPRSRVFASKELSTYIRPTMDVMGCLVHGHSCFLALSEPFLPKGSSFCADLVLHCLHRLARHGLDLRGVALHLQSDNTSKETKNNTLLRLSALLIALHRLKNIVLCQLESGHSHEDIDQWFSVITSVLQTHHEIHTPAQFVEVLNKWLRDPSTRVHETTERHAFLVESTRDWSRVPISTACHVNYYFIFKFSI